MDQSIINELELSISFGQRLLDYKKECLKHMLSRMDDNDKIRQHYQSDRSFINDIISDLEQGEQIQFLYQLKRRLSIVGQMFFKKEFQMLKALAVSNV